MKQFLQKIFESESGVSSKRFFGSIGFCIVLIVAIYCTIAECVAPNIIEQILYCSVGLLGLDSVTRIFKKNCNQTPKP